MDLKRLMTLQITISLLRKFAGLVTRVLILMILLLGASLVLQDIYVMGLT